MEELELPYDATVNYGEKQTVTDKNKIPEFYNFQNNFAPFVNQSIKQEQDYLEAVAKANTPQVSYDGDYKGTTYSPNMQIQLQRRDALLSSFFNQEAVKQAEYDFTLEDLDKYWQKEQIQQKFINPETGKPDKQAYDRYFSDVREQLKQRNTERYYQQNLPLYDPLNQFRGIDREQRQSQRAFAFRGVESVPNDITNQQWALEQGRIYDKTGKKQKYSGNYTDIFADWSDKDGLSYADLVSRGYYVDKGEDGKPILKEADWGTDLSMKDRLGYFGVSKKDEADWLYDIPYYAMTGLANGVIAVLAAPVELQQMLSEIASAGLKGVVGMSDADARYWSMYNLFTGGTNFFDSFKLGKYEGNEGWNKAISETLGFGAGMITSIVATGGLGAAGFVTKGTKVANTLSKVMTPQTGKIVNSLLLSPSEKARKWGFTLNMMALGSSQTMDAMRESGIDIKYRGLFAIPVGLTFAALGQLDDFLIGGNTGGRVLNAVGLLNTTALLRKNMVDAATPLAPVINTMTEREAQKFAMKLGENVIQKTVRSMMESPVIGRTLFETGQEISEELAGKLLLQGYNKLTPESWGRVKKEYTKIEGKDLFLAGIGGAGMGLISNITSRAKESDKFDSMVSLVTNDRYYSEMQKTLTEQADDKIRNKQWMYAPIDADEKGDVIPYGSFKQSANSVNATIAKENLTVLRNAWEAFRDEYKKQVKSYEGAEEAFVQLFKDSGDAESMYAFLAKDKFADQLNLIKPDQDNEQVIAQIQEGLKQQLDKNATGIKREFFDKIMYVTSGGNPNEYRRYNELSTQTIRNNFNRLQDTVSTNPNEEEIKTTVESNPENITDLLKNRFSVYVNEAQLKQFEELKQLAVSPDVVGKNIPQQEADLTEINNIIETVNEKVNEGFVDTDEINNLIKPLGMTMQELEMVSDDPDLAGEVFPIGDSMADVVKSNIDEKLKFERDTKIQKQIEQNKAIIDNLPERKNIEDEKEGQNYLAELSQDIYFKGDYDLDSLIKKANERSRDYSMQDYSNDLEQSSKFIEGKRNQIKFNYLNGKKVNEYLPKNEGDISPVLTLEQAQSFSAYLDTAEKALERLQALASDNESNFIKDNFISSLQVFNDKIEHLKTLFTGAESAEFNLLQDQFIHYEALIQSIDSTNNDSTLATREKESELFQLITKLEDTIYDNYQANKVKYDNIIEDLTVRISKEYTGASPEANTLLRQLFYLRGVTNVRMSEVNGKILSAVEQSNRGDVSKRFFPSYEQVQVLQELYLHTIVGDSAKTVISEDYAPDVKSAIEILVKEIQTLKDEASSNNINVSNKQLQETDIERRRQEEINKEVSSTSPELKGKVIYAKFRGGDSFSEDNFSEKIEDTNKEHYYKITITSPTTAVFEIYRESKDYERLLNGSASFTNTATIVGRADINTNSIITTERGQLAKQGDRWVITKKATVGFSNDISTGGYAGKPNTKKIEEINSKYDAELAELEKENTQNLRIEGIQSIIQEREAELQRLQATPKITKTTVIKDGGKISGVHSNTMFINGFNGTGKTKIMELFSQMIDSNSIRYFGHSEQQNINLQKIIKGGKFFWGEDIKVTPTTKHKRSDVTKLTEEAKNTLQAQLKTMSSSNTLIVDEHTLSNPEALTILMEASDNVGFKLIFIGDLGQASLAYTHSYSTDTKLPLAKSNRTREMRLQQRGGVVNIRKYTDYLRNMQDILLEVDDTLVNMKEEEQIKVFRDILANNPNFNQIFLYQQGEVDGEMKGISVVGNLTEATNLVKDRKVLYVGQNDGVINDVEFKSVFTAQGSEAPVVVLDLNLSMNELIRSKFAQDREITNSSGAVVGRNLSLYDTVATYFKALLSASGRAETHLIIIDRGNSILTNKMQSVSGKVSIFADKIEVRKAIYEQGLNTFSIYRNATTSTNTEKAPVDDSTPFSKYIPTLNELEKSGRIKGYRIEDTTLKIDYNEGSTGTYNILTFDESILNTIDMDLTIDVFSINDEGHYTNEETVTKQVIKGKTTKYTSEGEHQPPSDVDLWYFQKTDSSDTTYVYQYVGDLPLKNGNKYLTKEELEKSDDPLGLLKRCTPVTGTTNTITDDDIGDIARNM